MADPQAQPADPLINIDGRMEPQSRVIAGFKALSAKEQEVMTVAQKAQKLEQQLSAMAPDAGAYRNLQALLAKDPDAAKEQFDRIVRLAKGDNQPVQMGTEAATESKLALRLQELEQQIARVQATEAGRQHVAEIRSVMAEYPLFTNSPEARKLAESFVATLRANDQTVSVKDAVSAVHTDMQKLTNAGAAATVQAREALAASGGMAPTQTGATPGISEPPKLDKASLKNGGARAWLEKALTASLQGPRNATT